MCCLTSGLAGLVFSRSRSKASKGGARRERWTAQKLTKYDQGFGGAGRPTVRVVHVDPARFLGRARQAARDFTSTTPPKAGRHQPASQSMRPRRVLLALLVLLAACVHVAEGRRHRYGNLNKNRGPTGPYRTASQLRAAAAANDDEDEEEDDPLDNYVMEGYERKRKNAGDSDVRARAGDESSTLCLHTRTTLLRPAFFIHSIRACAPLTEVRVCCSVASKVDPARGHRGCPLVLQHVPALREEQPGLKRPQYRTYSERVRQRAACA